ncbi:uncharacterized protein [Misgurnus anguillicaudatus]|uniref:uncharacterized protein isoform X2 n=1 Tax=Misgurnus anguillicaudatus TaxID=75329 RepID=UPI003CCF6754
MDPLLPKLSFFDTIVPKNRQQCLLRGTKEANRNTCFKKTTVEDQKAACEEAKKRCRHFTMTPSEEQYLGQLHLTFGKYNGQSFKWLVKNDDDVGYIKYCSLRSPATSRSTWIGPFMGRAASGRLRTFSRTGLERKMAQEAYTSTKQWLVMKEEDITTKSLKHFRRYILDREKPPPDATPPSATSNSSRREPGSVRVLMPAATSQSSWSDDAMDGLGGCPRHF